MIRAEGIEKSFGSLKVLKGVDFYANDAEVVSIVGTSGAGKTTFLQCLGSLQTPDKGKVIIDDTDIFSLDKTCLAEFRNRRIGFVFQSYSLLPEFTALENVCIPAFIAGKSVAEASKRAKEILDFLGMAERMEHKPGELSGGEQQRVSVARALINSPAVILADEPSGNLDSQNKAELHKLFFSLRDNFGQTIVIVTHDLSLAQMSDRFVTMKDGVIAL